MPSGVYLPIQVTEFDVDVSDRTLQADYLRDFYTLLFSHPSVEGILMWGFWAGKHWRPNAALYDLDWNLREHGQMWYDLVFTNWWTDAVGTSDTAGRFSTRDFKGDYEVSATFDGIQVSQTVRMTEDRTVVLPPQIAAPWLSAYAPGRARGDPVRLRVHKGAATHTVLRRSPALSSGIPIHTNTTSVNQYDFVDPESGHLPRGYYRAEGW